MSAFVIPDKQLQQIVSYLNLNAGEFNHITKQAGFDLNQSDDLKNLADALYQMNCEAVDARYRQEPQGHRMFNFVFTASGNKFQFLKSVECLRYQCSEGNVPQSALYQVLTRIVNHAASVIVHAMPEYKATSWTVE